MEFQRTLNGFVQEIRRFNEETSAFINETLQTLRNLEAIVDHKLSLMTEVQPSTASNGSESNGTQERAGSESNATQERTGSESSGTQERAGSESTGRRERVAVKRSSDNPGDNDSPFKKPKIINDRVDDEALETSNGESQEEATDETAKTSDDEMNGHRSIMNIKANMGKTGTIDYLNQWLARVYDREAKFYTIKKSSYIGTFMFYVAIDVDLDEAKDDIHVVLNSDHLHRPDILFRFIENCFHEKKVVTLLHIVTSNENRLREDPVRLEKIIRTMVEPVVVHL